MPRQFGILGAVIEKADPLHRGLEQFMKEELFDKIGMKSTGFFVQGNPGDPAYDATVARFAVLYDNLLSPAVPLIPIDSLVPAAHAPLAAAIGYFQYYNYAGPRALPLGDGGLYSTFPDLVKFLQVILNNGKTEKGDVILSPAMIAALSRNQVNNKDISADQRAFTFTAAQEVKAPKWGLGVALNQGINFGTQGASRKQLWWGGAFINLFLADLTNEVIFHTGTNIFNCSEDRKVFSKAFQAYSVLYSALNKVGTFDEELYTPGTAEPYNFNKYVPTGNAQE